MTSLAGKYRQFFSDRTSRRAFWTAVGLFMVAVVVNYYAALYAAERVSNSVTDLILSNIPVFDVDAIFIFGPLIFWAIIIIMFVRDPKKGPFIVKSTAIFIIIRSIFITLTHLGPYPDRVPLGINAMFLDTWNWGNLLTFGSGGDLFFSGHTGLPFLMALVFWNDIKMRMFCLLAAVFFGVVVLLGHLHYSIDVLSAFFITYTIFQICKWLFPIDRKLFFNGETPPTTP